MKVLLAVLVFAQLVAAQNPQTPFGISDDQEVKIGRVLAAQFEKEEGMRPTPQTERFDAYLQTLGDKLAVHASRRIPYKIHFDPDPTFRSAVGLPGGQVFVGAGLLAYIDTEDQLAAVIGHEIKHIDLDQCRERLAKELKEKGEKKLEVDAFLPGYGKEREFAADRDGVILAMAAGYSPEGAIRLLQTYVILGQQMTHTQSEAEKNLKERIAQIERIRDEHPELKVKERPFKLPES